MQTIAIPKGNPVGHNIPLCNPWMGRPFTKKDSIVKIRSTKSEQMPLNTTVFF